MRVLCFGSLNIDYTYSVPHFVQPGETLSCTELRLFGGGKGLNQSVALARAGLNVSLAGAVGEDGRFLLSELGRAGVDTRHVDVLPGVRTGHAIIQNNAEGENCILVFGGANHCTGREQIDRVLGFFGEGDVLTLQNEIRELEYLIRSAKARGMTIAFTPAPMNAAVPLLPLELIDYLFLNEVEAGVLLGRRAEDAPLDAARALRERFGVKNVALTLGAAGSVFSGETGDYTQAALPTEPVDTTGAGDTFAGFFLAGALQGLDTQRAMYVASAAASIAITRSGASASIPDRDEVLEKIYRNG
ncbi:MAG: ribokinase [Oscillospiraceae bacterium]|nr:ribokinase [Oscillospiraceae bacterium]